MRREQRITRYVTYVATLTIFLACTPDAWAPNRRAFDHKGSSWKLLEKYSQYPHDKNPDGSCQITRKLSPAKIIGFVHQVAASQTLCLVHKGGAKVIYFPGGYVELPSALIVENADPDVPIELRGPPVATDGTPMAQFRPGPGFGNEIGGCALWVAGGVHLIDLGVAGFPGNGICVVDKDVTLKNMWLLNNMVGVDVGWLAKGIHIVDSFFQNNTKAAITSTEQNVEIHNNRYHKNSPVIISPKLGKQFPVPGIIAVEEVGQEIRVFIERPAKLHPEMALTIKSVELLKSYGETWGYPAEPVIPAYPPCPMVSVTGNQVMRCVFPAAKMKEGSGPPPPYSSVAAAFTYALPDGGAHTTAFGALHAVTVPVVPITVDDLAADITLFPDSTDGCAIPAAADPVNVAKFVVAVAQQNMKCLVSQTKKVIQFSGKQFALRTPLAIANLNSNYPLELRGPSPDEVSVMPAAGFTPAKDFPKSLGGEGISARGGVMFRGMTIDRFPIGVWVNGSGVSIENVWFINHSAAGVMVSKGSGIESMVNLSITKSHFQGIEKAAIQTNVPFVAIRQNTYIDNAALLAIDPAVEQFAVPVLADVKTAGGQITLLVQPSQPEKVMGIDVVRISPDLKGAVYPIPSASVQCAVTGTGKALWQCQFPSNELTASPSIGKQSIAVSATYVADGQQCTTQFSAVSPIVEM